MNTSVVDQNTANLRRARTLPAWLAASSSTAGSESQKNHSDDTSKLVKNGLPVTVKPEFTEFDDDMSVCSWTNPEPADVKPKVEEIPIETVFVREVDDTEFIREEENAIAVEVADSTNVDDSIHSDTDEVVLETYDPTKGCKVESTTPVQCSPSHVSASPTSSLPALPTSTDISVPSGRMMCIYRHKCYRTNPQHKKDFSHPGDADYDGQPECDSTSGDTPSKPRCRYGSNCYRKNEEHNRKFYHSPTNSHKRNATRVQLENTNEGDDSDAYDDSFINDDSEDELAWGSDDEENEFSDFDNYSSSDDDSYPGPGRSKKKKFSIL